MLYMKLYTFDVTGASPFDGEIKVVAKTIKTARRLAREAIVEYNGSANHNDIRLTGEEHCGSFSVPMIVHFESGEQ